MQSSKQCVIKLRWSPPNPEQVKTLLEYFCWLHYMCKFYTKVVLVLQGQHPNCIFRGALSKSYSCWTKVGMVMSTTPLRVDIDNLIIISVSNCSALIYMASAFAIALLHNSAYSKRCTLRIVQTVSMPRDG